MRISPSTVNAQMYLPIISPNEIGVLHLRHECNQFNVPVNQFDYKTPHLWWLKQSTQHEDLLSTPVGELYFHWTGYVDHIGFQIQLDTELLQRLDHQFQLQPLFNDVTMSSRNHLFEWRFNTEPDHVLCAIDPTNGIVFIEDDNQVANAVIPNVVNDVYRTVLEQRLVNGKSTDA